MDGQNWRGLKWIASAWVNLKNVSSPFFKFVLVYMKMSFTQLENHSQLLCSRYFANERLLLCQVDV